MNASPTKGMSTPISKTNMRYDFLSQSARTDRIRPIIQPTTSTRKPEIHDRPPDKVSPTKLNISSARISRQTANILSTLDTSSSAIKRRLAESPPKLRLTSMYSTNRERDRERVVGKENIPKRRKIVSFDDQLENGSDSEEADLKKVVLSLQNQVKKLQVQFVEEINRLDTKIDQQKIIISSLMDELKLKPRMVRNWRR
jgi:hypothetical protein